MASYTATLSLSNGTLAISRPHPAPEDVTEIIDSIQYRLTDGEKPTSVTSVGITIVTDDGPPPAPAPLPEDPSTTSARDPLSEG